MRYDSYSPASTIRRNIPSTEAAFFGVALGNIEVVIESPRGDINGRVSSSTSLLSGTSTNGVGVDDADRVDDDDEVVFEEKLPCR